MELLASRDTTIVGNTFSPRENFGQVDAWQVILRYKLSENDSIGSDKKYQIDPEAEGHSEVAIGDENGLMLFEERVQS